MKNIEKYIILVISLIAVGAIATAIYFSFNKFSVEIDKNNKVNNTDEIIKDKYENQEASETELCFGTFSGQSNDNNEKDINLFLKPDGSAVLNISSKLKYEATRGVFEIVDGKVIYTRKSVNATGYEQLSEEFQTTETFQVIDKNTLKINFNEQEIILNRELLPCN